MDGANAPSLSFRPKSNPSHLINGHSPLHPSYTAERDKEDRDSTYNSIKSSMAAHKEPIDLEDLSLNDDHPSQSSIHSPKPTQQRNAARQYEEVADQDIEDLDTKVIETKALARDVRDEAPPTPPTTTRSTSPFTTNPTIDFDGLSWPSVGTLSRLREHEHPAEAEARLQKLSGAVRTILECIGEDPDREGLHGTPERYAKAMMWFTKGYEENLRDIVNGAVFHEDHDELVIVKDIEVYSLCEHHLVPFTGKVGAELQNASHESQLTVNFLL
jgi:GTP cyclohydrolase IA